MSAGDDEPRGPGGLRRREFLALGSLAAAVPVLPLFERAAGAMTLDPTGGPSGPGTAAAPRAVQAPAPALPLSLGYLVESDLLQNLRKLPRDLRVLTITRRGNTFSAERSMVPAHSLPDGDPSLVGGAVRMTVHDLYPSTLPDGPAAERWPVAVDLDVLVPLLDPPPGSTARFAAWSYRRLPAEDRSARVSFVLWPDWYSDLGLVMRVVPAGAGGQPQPQAQLFEARFTLAAAKGRPRLRKGVYLLGLAAGAWEERIDLPDDPAQVPPELASVLVTIEPVGIRRG
jgi:hypothetical protein